MRTLLLVMLCIGVTVLGCGDYDEADCESVDSIRELNRGC